MSFPKTEITLMAALAEAIEELERFIEAETALLNKHTSPCYDERTKAWNSAEVARLKNRRIEGMALVRNLAHKITIMRS